MPETYDVIIGNFLYYMCEISTLKMEKVLFSEMSVSTYESTWDHNPEEGRRLTVTQTEKPQIYSWDIWE
jgi:hypothetical protein